MEENTHKITSIRGMFQDWFLDYASYVILERAVPHINDGLKPVQRRILHSMKELDDGRYNKVANIVGNTMKYHPHGDSSIAGALVTMGQKDLLMIVKVTGEIFSQEMEQQLRVILRQDFQNLLWKLCLIQKLQVGIQVMMEEIKSLIHCR